jgi:hypothetical protein
MLSGYNTLPKFVLYSRYNADTADFLKEIVLKDDLEILLNVMYRTLVL